MLTNVKASEIYGVLKSFALKTKRVERGGLGAGRQWRFGSGVPTLRQFYSFFLMIRMFLL